MSEGYPPATAVKPDQASLDWHAPNNAGPSTQGTSISAWEQANSIDSRSGNENLIKCSQCTYLGPLSSFPLRLNGNGHVKTCAKHTKPRRVDSKLGHAPTPSTNVTTVSWATLLEEVHLQAKGQIDLDRFIELDENHPGATGDTLLIRANTVMDGIKTAAGYRFNYKRRQDSTQKARKSTVFTYYCAQLEGEQTKHALHPDESRRRPKKLPKIPRFHCNGWASLTVTEEAPTIMRLRMTHAFAHVACFSNRPAGAGVGKARISSSPFLGNARPPRSSSAVGPSTSSAARIPASHDMSAEGFDASGGSQNVSQQPFHEQIQAENPTSSIQSDTSVVSGTQSAPFAHGSDLPVMDGVEQGSGVWSAPATDIDPSQRVCFPQDYLQDLKHKAEIAFAEADKEGGLSIDEARAFEAAFAPLAQLAADLEARSTASI